jgi:TRAP transporter TAXI family solute receptor
MSVLLRNGLIGLSLVLAAAYGPVSAQRAAPAASAALWPPTTTSPPFGIAVKRPVFAGACKACPWGVLATITTEALKPAGYSVQTCWVCWGNYGPRYMADKTLPQLPPGTNNYEYTEVPPRAVPDISATSEINLMDAWNGTAAYAADGKRRQNYRIIAAVQQPNYVAIAVTRKSGITDLSQIKSRTQPTWIEGNDKAILDYYGITEAGLKAKGGGFMSAADRVKRASADVFIGGAMLANTPEQRMWYEISQLNDLVFLDIPPNVLAKLAQVPGYQRASMPLAFLRGVDRPIPTVMRSAHVIYVRDDAPDDFAYTVAKALDEHQDLFRMYGDPWFYDPKLVARSTVIPLHPGALKYYRERGYVK